MNTLHKHLLGSLFLSALAATPMPVALAQQSQQSAATDPSAGYGPMGYGYGPGYHMGPGMMGYGPGYAMGPGMMGYGYHGYGMGRGMMGGWGLSELDLGSAQIDKISKILTNLSRTQGTLRVQIFKARLEAQEQINAVLTKEQRAALRDHGGGWGMMGY